MDLNIETALNPLSLSQVSMGILRELYKKNIQPCIFPIADININSYDLEKDMISWLESCINKSVTHYSKYNPGLKIWHLQNSHTNVSVKSLLYSFHETDEATLAEINIVKNQNKVIFPSKYSRDVFRNAGCGNVDNIPLAFDSHSFKELKNKQTIPDRITFGLMGKLESRKSSLRVINLWLKKFGNNPKYFLNCSLFNHHIPGEMQQQMINQAFEGKRYFNIQFLPFSESNSVYNIYLNSNDIVIDMSKGEEFSLPSFQSCCLGKNILALGASGILEWANDENSVLVKPSGKSPCYDNMFFKQGNPFNQGNFFDWKDEDFYEGMDKVLKRFEKEPYNKKGAELKQKFTYQNMTNKILFELEKL